MAIRILGHGGHAILLAQYLRDAGEVVEGFVTDQREHKHTHIRGIQVLSTDEEMISEPVECRLVQGIGSVDGNSARLRRSVFERYKSVGYDFLTVIHPAANVVGDVTLGEGVQIFPGAIVQPGSRIESNVLINTGAIVEHDCQVRAHTHLAPGSLLCGLVKVGQACHVGARATVMQGMSLADGTTLGAASLLRTNTGPGELWLGLPAKKQHR